MASFSGGPRTPTPGRLERTLCIESEGDLLVDVLHTNYFRESAAGLPHEGYLRAFRVHIHSKLQDMPLGSPERSKWEWMAGFFNDALVRHPEDVEPFESLPLPERD